MNKPIDLTGLSLRETVTTLLVEDPGDLVAAVRRKHPLLWRRVIELARARGRHPGPMLFEVIEAGLARRESQTVQRESRDAA